MEKYNISKASRFLNISSELLRHYERLRLIEPERGENGYRFFNYRDMDKLQGIRRYRNMNFSLEDMDRLIYTADHTTVEGLLEKSLADTHARIAWYQELAQATEQILADWRQIETGAGACELTLSKAVLRVDLRRNDVYNETVVTEETAKWIEKLPVVFISPYFKKVDILAGTRDVSFGYGVEAEAFERLGLSHIPSERYLPACKCVTTIVYSHGEESIGAHSLRPAIEYCREYGLAVCGDAWGITVGNCNRDGETYRYHRVFLPVG